MSAVSPGRRRRAGIDARLVVPASAAWVAAASALSGLPVAVIAAGWGASIVMVAIALAVSRWRAVVGIVAVSCALAALVAGVASVRHEARSPHLLAEAAVSGRHLDATAELSSATSDERFAATLVRVRAGDVELLAAVPVLVFADGFDSRSIGARVALDGRVVEASSGEDVAYLFFADGVPRQVEPAPWWLDWTNTLRSGFADAAAILPGDGARLLPGLAIGDTSAVGDSLDAAMKGSSLSHLTAVSGANCAVIVGLVMVGASAAGVRRGVRVAASVAVLVGFVALVTPGASVLRAAVMATVALVALARGRPARGVPLLSIAVIVLLVADPWLAVDYGFILSVLATGALLVLAGPIARALARWIPTVLATVISIPLAASLACQPVIVLLDSRIPVFGVVANLLAEPAAPAATVLGLASCVLMPVAPVLGVALARLAWVPASWIAAVANFFAGVQVPWLAGATGLALLAGIDALVILVLLTARARIRLVALVVLCAILLACVAASVATRVVVEGARPSDWQIAACDIGQGDAVLVRSAGMVALIDTGPDPALLTSCLESLRITHIDLLVLTHYDLDHVGGTPAVIGMASAAIVGPTDGADDERLRSDLAAGGATVTEGSRGMSGRLGELEWDVLWPRLPLAGVEPGNAASVTLEFRGAGPCVAGCLSAVFLGDLGEESQALLVAAGGVQPVDVVKVAHHGSADQDPRTYAAASAAVGIVSVGADNTYGHPTRSLLETLENVGTVAVRTDRDGMILLSPGAAPGEVSVWQGGGRGVHPRDGRRR